MDLVVVGLSHRTAPLPVRERLAFPTEELEGDLRDFAALAGVGEAVIVSTCNRVEVYGGASDPAVAGAVIRRRLAERHGFEATALGEHLYDRVGDEAVRHLFRVAASLDSLVVGEPQILGQIKEAFARSVDAGTAGPVLQRCMHRALKVARRIRTETAIGRESVSVSSVAVDLARKIFGSLEGRPVLLVGAGKMSQLALRKLRAEGAPDVLVANRSLDRAEALAKQCGGRPCDLARLGDLLVEADIVFASTAARGYVVGPEMMSSAMKARRHRPIFVIDTAVPRNVDPRVNDLANVYLYDMDDLQRVVSSNQAERMREAAQAEALVEAEVEAFAGWRKTLSVVPTVVALRERLDGIQEAETARLLRRLETVDGLTARDKELIAGLGRSIVGKILHSPVQALKRQGVSGDPMDLVSATQALFALDGPAAASEVAAEDPANAGAPKAEGADG